MGEVCETTCGCYSLNYIAIYTFYYASYESKLLLNVLVITSFHSIILYSPMVFKLTGDIIYITWPTLASCGEAN